VKGYAFTAMENIPLWHERDISHSSAERVIFPDAFIVTDYAVNRMASVLEGLEVNKKRMLENIESSQGQLFSSHVLLALVDKGLSREAAYAHVQRLSHGLSKGEHLREKILQDPEVSKYLKAKELDEIFSGKKHKKTIQLAMKRRL
ncbi:MAG: adenylosuccinate lyase, partial [Pseudobdellovibrionaceae bacterium]